MAFTVGGDEAANDLFELYDHTLSTLEAYLE